MRVPFEVGDLDGGASRGDPPPHAVVTIGTYDGFPHRVDHPVAGSTAGIDRREHAPHHLAAHLEGVGEDLMLNHG
jgi:hypothetical protein